MRPAVPSDLPYDRYYSLIYQQPATYIRFSSTVEDCTGCPYDLNEEDEVFLKSLNKKKKDVSSLCSPEQFEVVMYAFEETAQQKQPFAAVDSPPVLPFEEVELGLDEFVDDDHVRLFAKDIYAHWKTRRLNSSNRSLMIGLKVSTHVPE